jgi:predicted NAD/FAD-binding protein
MGRIAIIGSGISGMSAAYLLSRRHQVTLLEREERLGGHTHTPNIRTSAGPLPIDTGFIVHNDRTYPNLIRLLGKLGVERQLSDMSFSVACMKTGYEYSSTGLGGFFSQPRNLLRPRHYGLLLQIARFNHEALKVLDDPAGGTITLGEWLRSNGFSLNFSRHYLYPMASAVWSTSLEEIEEFPALTLARFFSNHGLLSLTNQPQWYVLRGGSSSYIAPLTRPYQDRIRLGVNIERVTRSADSVQVQFVGGVAESFDEVVFACHAPQALQMLADATPAEYSVLGSLKTSCNQTVLHTDERLLPSRQRSRASWNYHLKYESNAVALTYDMNRLQSLPVRERYCVTLNSNELIDPSRVLRELTYHHPLMNLEAIRAQQRWQEISGHNRTHFCGAYWFYGFHEDGLNSAIRVAQSMGVPSSLEA